MRQSASIIIFNIQSYSFSSILIAYFIAQNSMQGKPDVRIASVWSRPHKDHVVCLCVLCLTEKY